MHQIKQIYLLMRPNKNALVLYIFGVSAYHVGVFTAIQLRSVHDILYGTISVHKAAACNLKIISSIVFL